MTAIMSQPWDWETDLDEEAEQITDAYKAEDDEIDIDAPPSWAKLPGAWVNDAACSPMSGDLFYADENGSFQGGRGGREYVADVCRFFCPVREECLTYAIEIDDPYGIWGGMTYAERQAEKVRRGLAEVELVA